MFLFLSIFAGFMVALMIQLNGILQDAAGGLSALLNIHISGLLGILVLTLLLKILPLKGFRNQIQAGGEIPGKYSPEELKKKAPWYYLTAGMLGSAIVFLASVSYLKGGILVSLSGSLAGQTLAASITESLYSKERDKSPLLQRLLAPTLLIPGSLIIGFKEEVALLWILISWTPGIILMIQQSMNAGNTLRWGTPKTVLFNYISALTLIIPIFLIFGSSAVKEISGLPWYIISGGGLIGVFTTGTIAFLLLKAPALMVILGIYTGELSGGIILDLYNGNPIAIEKIMGILLIAAGLASGKINLKQKKVKAT
ncbi:MAG: DMT family transporter [Spirochaetales bacterium]|nr:DMT family transporter [Spirochaetales bacterium]